MSTTYYVWEKWSTSTSTQSVQTGTMTTDTDEPGYIFTLATSYYISGSNYVLNGTLTNSTSVYNSHGDWTQYYTFFLGSQYLTYSTMYKIYAYNYEWPRYYLYCYVYEIQTVTGKGSTYYGVVKSTSPSAYPNGGASGGYWYSNRQSIAMPDTYAKQNGAWVASPDRLDKQNGAWTSGYELYKQNGAWVV